MSSFASYWKDKQNFQQWFKGSRVVDSKGQPLVVYHGTKSDKHFTVFSVDGIPQINDDDAEENAEPKDKGSGAEPNAFMGAHFAEEPEVAGTFAGVGIGADWLKTRHKSNKEVGGRIYPVFLRITKPIQFASEDEFNDFIYSQDMNSDWVEEAMIRMANEQGLNFDDLNEDYTNDKDKTRWDVNIMAMALANEADGYSQDYNNHAVDYARELAETAKSVLIKKGYDGVRYKNDIEGGISWIAFYPNQIKSAITSGFTPDEDDITKESRFS